MKQIDPEYVCPECNGKGLINERTLCDWCAGTGSTENMVPSQWGHLMFRGKPVITDEPVTTGIVYILEKNPVKRFFLRIWEILNIKVF